MYQPQYTITDALLNHILKIEIVKSTLSLRELSYQLRTKLTMQAKAANLFHLAHMQQLSLSLKDAEKLAEGRKLEVDPAQLRLLVNLRNVLEFNRSNVAEGYLNTDGNLLLHLNKIMLTGWKDTWEIKIREGAETPDAGNDNWVAGISGVSADSLKQEVTDLMEWYQLSDGRVHNLIRTAVLLYRLVQLQPFFAGNKLTMIALTDFLLHQHGYIANAQIPMIRIFDQYEGEFLNMWQSMNPQSDMTTWIELFVKHLASAVGDVKLEVEHLVQDETEKSSTQPFLDLNKRQLKILRYLQTIPTVKREDYCAMMEVSTMTAFRDLNDLVRKKLIKIEGQGRGTKYMLVSR